MLLAACSAQEPAEPVDATTAAALAEEVQMRISSAAFEADAIIPTRHTCDGVDLSPPLTIEDVPDRTVSLVLIVDDPDAPVGTWDHWIAFDIPPTDEIPEGVGQLGTAGLNSWGRKGYGGPCPPSGTHRYFFKLYALDIMLDLPEGVDKTIVVTAMEGHILGEASLMGRYAR